MFERLRVARVPNPRLRAARAREAERTVRAAEIVKSGAMLDEDTRHRLADLLDVLGRAPIREELNVHVSDRAGALTDAVNRSQADPWLPPEPLHGLGRD